MAEPRTNPYNHLTIKELLEEKQLARNELALAYRAIDAIRGKMTILDQAINQIKMPNANSSRANRIAAMPMFAKKAEPVEAPAPVVAKPKKQEYFQPSISEHALVRYMERIMDYDMDKLRNSILTKDIRAALSAGVTRISINGIEMVARDGKIITVLD